METRMNNQQDIREQIKNFDDVLKYHNITDAQFNGTTDEVAYQKLKLITLALNEGWTPNWGDSDERKYYPWFKMASGGFSYFDYVHDWTYSFVGPRLCFRSSDLAIYATNTFTDIYKDFFTL